MPNLRWVSFTAWRDLRAWKTRCWRAWSPQDVSKQIRVLNCLWGSLGLARKRVFRTLARAPRIIIRRLYGRSWSLGNFDDFRIGARQPGVRAVRRRADLRHGV